MRIDKPQHLRALARRLIRDKDTRRPARTLQRIARAGAVGDATLAASLRALRTEVEAMPPAARPARAGELLAFALGRRETLDRDELTALGAALIVIRDTQGGFIASPLGLPFCDAGALEYRPDELTRVGWIDLHGGEPSALSRRPGGPVEGVLVDYLGSSSAEAEEHAARLNDSLRAAGLDHRGWAAVVPVDTALSARVPGPAVSVVICRR